MSVGDDFLALSPQRVANAFGQAATNRAIHPVMVEKDFWVCWLLAVLFSQPELSSYLVFKGGTSLSKVFGAIDRFSEDIDLSVAPEFVGAKSAAFDALTTRTKRDTAIREMQRLCGLKTERRIMPDLEAAIRAILGTPTVDANWLNYEIDQQTQAPTINFRYPAIQASAFEYIRRVVKLEMGSLTDQQPTGIYTVRPWVADDYPTLFRGWRCDVTALELERTFWEKATILHAEFHRADGDPTPPRYARHYSDTARLLDHPNASAYLKDKVTCERVADWKDRSFGRRWARYDMARHGTMRLVPPSSRTASLAADYEAMRPMFFTEPPPFADVLARLAAAEETINSL